ncbi:MAG TPA: ATP-binding protein [Fimbriimonadaceae bacterium]|nr:ATP-binding protein [Fimbriimonadaceae bacterium]
MRSLRVQLLISHLVLVLLLAVVMTGAIRRLFVLSQSLKRVTQSDFSGQISAERMHEALAGEQTGITICLIGRPDLAESMIADADHDFSIRLVEHAAAVTAPDSKELAAQAAALHGRYRAAIQKFLTTYRLHGRQAGEAVYVSTVRPIEHDLNLKLQDLIAANRTSIAAANVAVSKDANGAFFTSILVTAGALVLAIFLALRMVRMALTPLAHLAKHAEVIGGGDLTRKIDLKRSDEIGALADAFDSMAAKLAELRKSEIRRLQRAEQMSDAALESLYDPVVVTDARGRIVHLNSAAEGIFGPTPEARTPVEDHIADRRIVRAIQQAVQQEAVSAEEGETAMIPVQVEGTQRTYRLRSSPMHTAEGLVLGSVTVLEDVTHLREVDRLKNEFIGVASHELRTPVTSLLLSVQLLEEGAAGPLSEAQRELIAAQRSDLDRLERLMRELLDITRLEAGTMVPRLSLVPAAELLAAACEASYASAVNAHVALAIEREPSQAKVFADRSQIQRVLVNLISNAVRHTPPGGAVTLRASDQGDDVRFEVTDTGVGIPQEYQSKIFDRFVQVPGATQGGAGLGLAIVRTIVEAHGGIIGVSSVVGEGSTFHFTLRRESAGAPSPEVPA